MQMNSFPIIFGSVGFSICKDVLPSRKDGNVWRTCLLFFYLSHYDVCLSFEHRERTKKMHLVFAVILSCISRFHLVCRNSYMSFMR